MNEMKIFLSLEKVVVYELIYCIYYCIYCYRPPQSNEGSIYVQKKLCRLSNCYQKDQLIIRVHE